MALFLPAVPLLQRPVAFNFHSRKSRGQKQRQLAAAGLAGAAVLLAWLLSIARKGQKGGERRRGEGERESSVERKGGREGD